MYDISTNIPHQTADSTRYSRYPFAKLEVGHSFLVPVTTAREILSARASTTYAQKRLGIKLATKMTDEGLRIWRRA